MYQYLNLKQTWRPRLLLFSKCRNYRVTMCSLQNKRGEAAGVTNLILPKCHGGHMLLIWLFLGVWPTQRLKISPSPDPNTYTAYISRIPFARLASRFRTFLEFGPIRFILGSSWLFLARWTSSPCADIVIYWLPMMTSYWFKALFSLAWRPFQFRTDYGFVYTCWIESIYLLISYKKFL